MFKRSARGRQYNFLIALFLSASSVDLYHDVLHNWKWRVLIYFFFLSLLVTPPKILLLGLFREQAMDIPVSHALAVMPDIQVTDGKVTVANEVKQPLIMANSKTRRVLIVIDTENTIRKKGRLISSDIYISPHKITLPHRSIHARDLPNGTYNSTWLIRQWHYVPYAKHRVQSFLLFVYSLIDGIVVTLPVSLLVYLVARFQKIPYSLLTILQFAFMAYTTAAFIGVFALLLPSYYFYQLLLIQAAVTIIILYFNMYSLHKWQSLKHYLDEP